MLTVPAVMGLGPSQLRSPGSALGCSSSSSRIEDMMSACGVTACLMAERCLLVSLQVADDSSFDSLASLRRE